MAPVLVDFTPRRDEETIEFIDDLDELVESTKCSCNAGDDNPY